MDLQNEAIELQKVFHKDYKTYWEETEAIKTHLEARFKALGLYDVSKSFAVGKEVQITHCIKGHGFEIGEFVEIVGRFDCELWKAKSLETGNEWYITEEEANVC